MEPLILPRNCGNCEHFDGEHWCSLAAKDKLIHGIVVPARVVCEKHEAKEQAAK